MGEKAVDSLAGEGREEGRGMKAGPRKKRYKVTLTVFVDVRPEAKDDEVRRAALTQLYIAVLGHPLLVYEEVGKVKEKKDGD